MFIIKIRKSIESIKESIAILSKKIDSNHAKKLISDIEDASKNASKLPVLPLLLHPSQLYIS